MEMTAMSMGKAVLDGALGYAKSKAVEEIALQHGVKRDVDFITDELQMMQSFLEMADEDNGQNKVFMTCVKQIRDLAYIVEDSLMNFGLHSEKKPFWGCIPRSPSDRLRIATEVKELRAKVEDVSNRNLWYRLINDHKDSSTSKSTAILEQEKSEVDLHQLITSEEEDLRVTSMWRTSSDYGKMSAIQEVYDDPKNTEKNIMTCANAAMFATNEARCTDMEEKMKVVHASSSVQTISDLKVTTTTTTAITKKVASMTTSEIQQEDERPKNSGEDKVCNSTGVKKFNRNRTLTGRETEKSIVIKLVGQPDNNQVCKVISVWGMSGMGKTTLVQSVYRSQELAVWKHAWVTASRPFNPEVLLRDLALQLKRSIQEDPAGKTSHRMAMLEIQELKAELARLLKTQKCLVVLDGISSTSDWDSVKGFLNNAGRIIITTREKIIAEHCSREYKNMYSLEGLQDAAALELFTKKVLKDNTERLDFVPAMMEQAKIILEKCGGHPLAVSMIGRFLATKPNTATEWRMINDRISAEQEINAKLRTINTVVMRSYDGLPYYLKSAFLYLSIFPENHKIRLDRLVRRWIAEGYSPDMHGITAEQLGCRYFEELLDRSMILPVEDVNYPNGKIGSCQLHDIIREICISKAREEHHVFTLEDGCCLSSIQGPIRHLVIGSNWKRDGGALPSVLDLSHLRSLTVFGDWRPFFLSENMRFLQVFDLEDTIGLRGHHLDRVGQLHHLKYLSLRGCVNIFYLPNSLGNLTHLQTLDVRGTHIFELPTTITNLGKLQNLHAALSIVPHTGCYYGRPITVKGEDVVLDMENHSNYISFCSRYAPFRLWMYKCSVLLRPQVFAGCLNMRDVLSLCRFHMEGMQIGTKIPIGIGRLKALQTLGGANVFWDEENAIVKEFKELTELRKLRVFGISNKNRIELWSAIAGHHHLRSLSVAGHLFTNNIWDDLDGCLGEGLLPPSWLESLKLCGKLARVADWIHQLQNLCKLVLEFTRLYEDDDIQALRVLPNLAVLRLKKMSFLGIQLHFQNSSFPSLVNLEINYLGSLESLLFEEGTMPRLELLQIYGRCLRLKKISGLSVLTSLEEIRLGGSSTYIPLQEQVRSQLKEHVAVSVTD